MDLNNVTVEMRPRGEWEAVDFGARLVRRDAGSIYRVWFAITLPMLLVAILVSIFTSYGALAAFVYWWLEPVTDGPILRIISRRLFGETADVGSALRSLPHLLKRNLIFLLPPYRFHMARSTAMPVTQLEGLRGADRKARAKVLNVKIANHGMGVTVAYHHLATAIYFGVYLLCFALIPTTYQDTIGFNWLELSWSEDTKWTSVINLVLIYIAQSALHPWFVGAGFGLYINCRTQLEAWDIEVAFRRLVQRRTAGPAVAVVLMLIAIPLALIPVAGFADEVPVTERSETADDPGFVGFWTDEEAKSAMNRTDQDEALSRTREVEEWKKINSEPGEGELDLPNDGSGFWTKVLASIGSMVAFIVEFGLWLAVAGLIVLLIVTRERWLPYVGFELPERKKVRRVMLSSGEVTAESLPADIPAEARKLWNDGKAREALSLLYRGSVLAAAMRYNVRIPPSATETLCVDAVNEQAESEQADFFSRLVRVWIACAYGFTNPAKEDVFPLCDEWQRHFGEPA